ncbi:hypothetical protein [Desulfolutivibrio sulfoxidireducens]|uniref:hypothetical protein n=1 Tax=Desulfolutivibrio sulfoxidireducens TaxID=2773299 RepID=UPI00159E875F|nr:hypothetical protein [Desulfolutivibrio sulfoxidireducens]QLA15293.1 hypothetical protein GD605_03635 [Desulfolutivibrio sulfoxidireducens]QLA18869.1 hypothetical protein GD604_03550 [Desulfolutivibrio sulfoxidireducens]
MHDTGCVLVGEFQFGPEISFERLTELEGILKNAVMDLVAGLGADHLEFTASGDALGYQSQAPGLDRASLAQACRFLIPFLDEGVKGRLVCVRWGLGDVDVIFFSRGGVEPVTTPSP